MPIHEAVSDHSAWKDQAHQRQPFAMLAARRQCTYPLTISHSDSDVVISYGSNDWSINLQTACTLDGQSAKRVRPDPNNLEYGKL